VYRQAKEEQVKGVQRYGQDQGCREKEGQVEDSFFYALDDLLSGSVDVVKELFVVREGDTSDGILHIRRTDASMLIMAGMIWRFSQW